MSDILKLIMDNREWIFSGIGVLIISGIFTFLFNLLKFKNDKDSNFNKRIINNISVKKNKYNNDININQSFGFDENQFAIYLDGLIKNYELILKGKLHMPSDRDFYKDFVLPIFDTFESVHLSYIETFKSARKLVNSSKNPFHKDSIFQSIKTETLLSQNLRHKLGILATCDKSGKLERFVRAIEQYMGINFTTDREDGFEDSPVISFTQGVNSRLIEKIHFYSDNKLLSIKEKKSNTLRIIDELIKELQDKYSAVFNEFVQLKTLLLNNEKNNLPLSTKFSGV
ncbi:MAG: hypothetical protein HOO91_06105 [Bacteroidales bacterium]|nr:hypothetical protein [Bacteroidales bacterium]